MSIIGDLAISPKAVVQGLPATGDSYDHKDSAVQGVMFVNFPLIDVQSLLNKTDSINIHSQSGKDLGTMVLAHTEVVPVSLEEVFLLASTGKLEEDKWVKVKNIVGSDGTHDTVQPIGGIETYKNIGDLGTYPQREASCGIKFASFSKVKQSALLDARHPINNHSISGKRAGSMVISYDGGNTNVAIMIAAGADRKEPWCKLVDIKGTTNKLTPIASDESKMGELPLTGDGSKHVIKKEGVYVSTLPCYEDTPFKDTKSPENDTKRSGKRLGSMVVLHNDDKNNYSVFMAAGDKPNSPWVNLCDLKNTMSGFTPTDVQLPSREE